MSGSRARVKAPQRSSRATSSPPPASSTARPAVPPAPRPPGALDVEGLTKTYGDLVALAPLDLRVEAGQSVALIGHNGSGKTTLLRMAAGLLEPTGGSVSVMGHEAGSLGARAALAYLSDSPTFYDDLSVWEHCEFVARLHGVEDWEQRAADLLGAVGLYERADDLPMRFSRGLKQKASIVLALVRPCSVLLVDEPFVGLDATGKQVLLELLDEVHDGGAAIVVATHELQFVQRVQRCLALREGAVVHDGPGGDVDVLALVS